MAEDGTNDVFPGQGLSKSGMFGLNHEPEFPQRNTILLEPALFQPLPARLKELLDLPNK
ncbi:MAG: hypothetical protein IJK97_09720 [Thermoguttaceae bacterium]|nr:hypothetical protein [Thermoguttaceae bacterium]